MKRSRSSFTPNRSLGTGTWMLLLVGLSGSAYTTCAQDTTSRPHVRRQGQNLAPNWNVATAEDWHVAGNARYEASASRTADGSGSFKRATPYYEDSRNAGRVASALTPIEGGKRHTLGFFARTANDPTLVSTSLKHITFNDPIIDGITSGEQGPFAGQVRQAPIQGAGCL